MSCKTDCYWYHEDQDMNAVIPECKARKLYPLDERDCEKCNKYHSKLKQTNADRIRSMTDEELADFLVKYKAFISWTVNDAGITWHMMQPVIAKELAAAWLKKEVTEICNKSE